MARSAIAVTILFLCMIVQPVVGNISAPNDSEVVGNSVSTLSIDGFVTTKFASVGSEVDIQAYTMGHSTNTFVSADIVKYDIDPLDSVISTAFPGEGQFVDRVVLVSTGVHEDDSNIMTWQGSYTIPVSAMGGTYGARIFAEDGTKYALDDPTQLREVFRGEFEKVLQAVDTAWDSANPLSLIADEFFELESKGTSNGGWSNFVAVATEGSGAGGSQQLWNSMLNAGHTQYNMSAGANFLEALMVMLDSDDAEAGILFMTGLMMYLHDIPIPRSMYQFEDLAEYIQSYDPIENFTRFEGTDQFEAAYNGMIGSNQWTAMEEAIDNLANNVKPFESAQTIMHNIALLAVSDHPQAIIDGLTAFAEPLFEGDFDNMTPFQQFVLRFAEMAGEISETDIQDLDGDDIPDVIRFQYENLLDTQEGQAWTLKMQTDAPWVNDAFDDFNTLPEDILEIVIDSTENPVWEQTGEVLGEFGSWMNNATRSSMESEWPNYDEEGEEDEDGGNDDSGPEPVIFDELHPMQTMDHDSHLLEVGISLRFDTDAYCDGEEQRSDEEWRNEVISISMTNDRGYQVSTELVKRNQWGDEYLGLLIAPEMESTTWTLSQPLEDYDSCEISYARIEVDSQRPSMLESMAIENNDEIFMVSALGVLVEQDEISQFGDSVTVTSQTYDSAGVYTEAEADIAILRISPQLGQSAVESLSPQGDHDFTVNYPNTLEGMYTGQDLDGDMTIEIMPMGEYNDYSRDRDHPQSYEFEAIELTSNGISWDASNYLPNERGVVDLVISGTTTEGIEFTEMRQMPLPGSLGCTVSEGSANGNNVNVGYNYRTFEADEGERFYKPGLDGVTVSWGDGQETEYNVNEWEEDPSGWEGHDYASSGEYYISVEYEDENGMTHTDNLRYDTDMGFWQEDSESDEGGYWTDWMGDTDCWLESEESSTPSPEIIDNFITGGPAEVITEQVMDVDENGLASLTFSPNHPGMYITIVQSKAVMDDGETKTGIGLNFVYVTRGTLEITGLNQVTTFAGLPVYTRESTSELQALTVTTSGISSDEYNVTLGIAPLKIDVAFPDFDWDSINDAETHELEFQQGDTSRTQEVRFDAPISFIGAAVTAPDGGIELEAAHFGIVLNNPAQLDMLGSLGPGQTTNVALNEEFGEATRILSVAVPQEGFDPATIDFASFTSFIYDEGVRPDVGWVAEDEKSVEICERMQTEPVYDSSNYNLRIRLEHRYDNRFKIAEDLIDPSNSILMDNDGNEVQPVPQMNDDGESVDWRQEWEGSTEMVAHFNLDSENEYTLHTGTEVDSEFEVMPYDSRDEENCGSDDDLTEEETFDMFDDLFGNVKSIAWGIGSSADLSLPDLASPISNYTVLGLVQQGTGDSATITAAIGSQVAEPNPEPLVMKDLVIEYLPENPSAGDTMLITLTEEETGLPVEMLSVVIIEDDFTIGSALTDYNGQTAFVLQEGTFLIRASGGMYNAIEFTITVTQDGSQEEETTDSDGDGIPDSLDYDDDNDGVEDIYDLCPKTAPGVTVDNDGCPVDGIIPGCTDSSAANYDQDATEDDGSCVYSNPDDILGCTDSTAMNYNQDATVDDGSCEFPGVDDIPGCTDSTASNFDASATYDDGSCDLADADNSDSTSDSSENKILGMSPITLGALSIGLILAIVAATMYIRRGRDGSEGDWYEEENTMFDEPYKEVPPVSTGPVSRAPTSPPPNHQGYMQDGYEVSEYPEGSGKWWWKDAQTGSWNEWK